MERRMDRFAARQLEAGAPVPMVSFEAPVPIAYVNGLFIIGTLGTLITPALFAAWAHLNWTPSRLGLVAAIELMGLAAGSLSGLYWQRRWNWQGVALPALLLAALGNAACMVSEDFATVSVARGLAGLGGGLLCAVYSAFLANTKSPSRLIALTTFIQIAVEAVIIFSSNSVFLRFGSPVLFGLMAALLLLLVPPLRFLPASWPADVGDNVHAGADTTRSWRGYPLLLAFAPFVVVQTGVYAFLGEFGRMAANLPIDQTLRAIAISIVLSSLGSVAAYVVNNRGGVLLPIAGAILVMATTTASLILASHSFATFLASIALLQIAWIFLNCYLYTALIEASNLLVPAATPIASFGSAFGASAMGYVLEHGGLPGALYFSIGALSLTSALTIPFITRVRILNL
jgi:predicted MFS family arabinose efflux permease